MPVDPDRYTEMIAAVHADIQNACAPLLETIAGLEAQLMEARKQMESQKNEWLSWDAKRASLEKDSKHYAWIVAYMMSGGTRYHEALTRTSSKEELDSIIASILEKEESVPHEGMTIAGNGAEELGALMRSQYDRRGGVYPDGNPNSCMENRS